MSVRSYILDSRVISLLKNDTVCVQCGIRLNIGDAVHSKRSASTRRRLYCDKCAVDLYLIDDSADSKEKRTPM